jgi:hypothetical protein
MGGSAGIISTPINSLAILTERAKQAIDFTRDLKESRKHAKLF